MFPYCSNCLEGMGLHNKTSILGENYKQLVELSNLGIEMS